MAIDRSGGPSPAPPAPAPRVITLNHAEHNDSTLYRFEKGDVVQFSAGPSLLGRRVFLYTNYVLADTGDESESAEFVRTQYYPLEWVRGGVGAVGGVGEDGEDGEGVEPLGAGAQLTDTDVYARLRLRRAGTFHYYFVYDTASSGTGPSGSGWVQCAPALAAGGRALPLDALCCVTVLAKCLGPLPRWLAALRLAKEAHYNMIHFTPVQELGASRSSYSISNQLAVNPAFGADGRQPTFADIENVLTHIRNEWQMLSICDVVLNHTANESPWLRAHPEAAYNCRDCPHLRPAALLDAALARLTADLEAGRLAPALPAGAPLVRAEQLEALRGELERRLPLLALHECFQCDAPLLARTFHQLAASRVPPPPAAAPPPAPPLGLALDPQRRRLAATVDMELALQIYNVHRDECSDEEARVRECTAAFRRALDLLNAAALAEAQGHLRAAIDNCIAGIRYERLSAEGPRLAEVSARHPLVPPYFTWPPGAGAGAGALSDSELEALVYGGEGALVMAHNGWVMDADPLADFADTRAGGRVYLRRELVAWGDSVKLRYGARPADCPPLWARMRDYVELTAELFDGLRLDNCHSTPLHVAEYLLDAARNVKPELYVVAELFTNSPHLDNVFVNRLGITSLIRECMAAWDSHEQGRLVHRFGGRPVGAFLPPPAAAPAPLPAAPAVAHALLLDLTHDNPSPILKRSVQDALATAGVAAMACCGCGSTRGLDELVPHHIHVVNEERLYCEWEEGEEDAEGGAGGAGEGAGRVGARAGIVEARRALNRLHAQLAAEGYSEVFVDQMDPTTLAITRHHPRSRKSVILVARNAFSPPARGAEAEAERPPRPLRVEGHLEALLLEAEISRVGADDQSDPSRFVGDPRYITGLQGWACAVRRGGDVAHSQFLAGADCDDSATTLRFRRLPPGGVLALRVGPPPAAAAALQQLHALLAAPAAADPLGLAAALQPLALPDLNVLLYRCEPEERAHGAGGVYEVPGHGALVYAGLQGAASLLEVVRACDDLGHPLCANLRAGPWLPEFTAARLERHAPLRPLAAALRSALEPLNRLPSYLQPAYFTALHQLLHAAATAAALRKLANWCSHSSFGRALALTSVQLVARDPSAPLPLPPPAQAPSLSAGLPHFATGYMRCWGRDTFVAFRGLLLLTARYTDARNHIVGFGACLRHGLIPNLLDGGRSPRYNCRDAVWWWLRAIQQYCSEAPDGAALLAAPVPRLFPHDDSEALQPGAAPLRPLHAVMQEALDAHFQGRVFRERNAGRAIDAHMSDAGFTVQFGVRPDTGFVFGGNDDNAGTWMDKMGSSERAGNRGRPATPRDGSAIELVALAYSTARWLQREHRAARYPHPGVSRAHPDGSATAWSWQHWADTIHAAFERHFWVPAEPGAADARPDLVHRRAIYKDTLGATRAFGDYQLRCNYAVAMAVAPDLFEPKHAWAALDAVEQHLLGPLGLKTLDPADWAYRPHYDNANDSDDPSVAHGFNYHQGPEWGWPLGFYLRARLHFGRLAGHEARSQAAVLRALGPLAQEIRSSPWRGLPELTGPGGAPCPHSCPSQAWSAAAALEVLRELRLARKHTLLD